MPACSRLQLITATLTPEAFVVAYAHPEYPDAADPIAVNQQVLSRMMVLTDTARHCGIGREPWCGAARSWPWTKLQRVGKTDAPADTERRFPWMKVLSL